MDLTGLFFSCTLIFGLAIIFNVHQSSLVFQRPNISAIFIFLCTSAVFRVIGLRLPDSFTLPSSQRTSGVELELSHHDHIPTPSRPASTIPNGILAWSSRATIFTLFVIRIELLRQPLRGTECAVPGIMTGLPLFYVLLIALAPSTSPHPDDRPWRIFGSIFSTLGNFSTRSMIAALVISISSILLSKISDPLTSTYICFLDGVNWNLLQQLAGLLIDGVLLVHLKKFLVDQDAGGQRVGQRSNFGLSFIFLVTAISLLALEIGKSIVFRALPFAQPFVFSHYINDFVVHGSIAVVTIVCSVYLLLHITPLEYSLIIVTVYTHVRVLTDDLSTSALSLFGLLYLGIFIYLGNSSAVSSPYRIGRSRLAIALSVLFLIALYKTSRQGGNLQRHPIDILRAQAELSHKAWVTQASSSKNLEEAVKTYRTRYGRDPPPTFDIWYNYAVERNSMIIDDFDSIYRDLNPFWSLTPKEIRYRTWEALSKPWNEILILKIRDGKIDLGPNKLPTHRWMMEGVGDLIKPFAEHIPDMDLALNLNDESRVAVGWENMKELDGLVQKSSRPSFGTRSSWTKSRASQWEEVPDEPINITRFEDHSFENTFHTYAATTCPPTSLARSKSILNIRNFCSQCAEPHSLGLFISNWTLAAEICHQPDLANLHGFFLSPSAFKTTRDLMPVFSQSKVHGYNDILYPSAWNYMDKAKYEPSQEQQDPSFIDKDTTLFWRGATSEGYSKNGVWRGMARQRLVRLTNSNNSLSSSPILLPDGSISKDLTVSELSPLSGDSALTDVGVVGPIARCAQPDCGEQERALRLADPVDFQQHWRFKYLFDLDGAGFSGRFLPFLLSRSLPFKTALFREWYDNRLTPWLHFVPQDLRLHGLYSTLAYFAGFKADVAGKDVKMKPHYDEGARIANEGREWAKKVLRKEDMEIYMFRLLLEWGRLTDDRRDELGFSL